MTAGNGHGGISSLLERVGIKGYEYRDRVPFSNIDPKASINRAQGRWQDFDEDHGLLVALAMEEHPEEVPPLLLYQPPRKKKLETIDGNHRRRFGAELAGIHSWPAVVIMEELTPMRYDVLLTAINRHGKPYSLEELVAHAVGLVEKYGISGVEAAREVGLGEKQAKNVNDRLRAIEATRRFEALGLTAIGRRMRPSTRDRLNSIHSDEVMKAATRLIDKAKMNASDASSFVTELNRHHSQEAQLAAIEQARDRLKPETELTVDGRFEIPQIVKKFNAIYARTVKLNPDDLVEEKDRIGPYAKQMKLRCKEMMETLLAVQGAL